MVGEIRDRETAQIAIEAALTGHLVLSTLHTNDAPPSITRLIEMGIEPFLVASALDCVVAQRLVRVLCPHCKRRAISADAGAARERLRRRVRASRPTSRSAARAAAGRGYRGRVGLYEVMTGQRRDPGAGARAPRPRTRSRDGRRCRECDRLEDDGLDKVRQGRTSIAEIARVVTRADAD